MAEPLILTVPMPQTLTNASGGSRNALTVNRRKHLYWDMLDTIVWLRGRAGADVPWVIPTVPAVPIHRATLTVHMVLGGAMDDENAAARCKWVIDWLVTRRYLATDRRERKKDGAGLRWTAFPEQRVTRKELARISLVIQPVPIHQEVA